jgi:hypothetical protein
LFTYQYDPIRILETNSTYIPENTDSDDEEIIANEKEIATAGSGVDNIDITVGEDEEKFEEDSNSNSSEENQDSIEDLAGDEDIDKWKEIVKDNDTVSDQNDNNNNDIEENHDSADIESSVDELESTDNINSDITIEEPDDKADVVIDDVVVVEEDAGIKDEDKNLLELSFDGISLLAEHFLTSREIEMHSELLEKDLSL